MKSTKDIAVNIDDVKLAANRIRRHIHRTPVLTSETLSEMAGCHLFFKCENFQKSGSFKIRGAINAVSQLTKKELAKGVVTHSSGNHAGALALAAKVFGTQAHIVMPSNSSAVKKAAVQGYGANIVECEPTLEARLSVSEKVRAETGATMIPPFDHPHVIAGQGTCAFEFLEQASSIDVLVAPIGGGGLMSGTCIAAKAYSQPVTAIGAEPKGADDAYRSKQDHKFVPQTNPQTVADGLRTSLGDLTWPFIRDQVDEIFCVEEDRIIEVMRFFWERTKVIIEPSSAVPVAAVLNQAGNPIFAGKSVGIIITGGNVDLNHLPWD